MVITISAPAALEHGEIFGALTVLKKQPNGKYRCLCTCGFKNVLARASALMKGRVTRCKECRELVSCKED